MSYKNYAKDFYPAEIMAAFISRNLAGYHAAGHGHAAQIPWVAIRLAQATHSPDLWFNMGPADAINPKYDKMLLTQNLDHRVCLNAEAKITMTQNIELFNNPKTFREIGFFGGFQIDKYGNCNMAYMGEKNKPKFRGATAGRTAALRSNVPLAAGTSATASGSGWSSGSGVTFPRLTS